MSQRTLAGILAVPLLAALWLAALLSPLPFITYSPGVTVDVLGEQDGAEIVQVEGQETYRDDGQLRLTTVYVSRPQSRVNIFEVLAAWVSQDDAVLPYDAVYAPDQTREQSEREGALQMASSQDVAVAVALTELGHDVSPFVEVVDVGEGLPADGRLKVRDVLLEVGGQPVATPEDVVEVVDDAPVGEPLEFVVERDGERRSVSVTPAMVDGDKRVGITPASSYEFPFDVSLSVDPNIGGPSAGLVFALSIYDTLTPGSLTGGRVVAGTGILAPGGAVKPIGGIAQKIAAARDEGAELFLVPPGNCDEAVRADNDDMRLVRADTMHSAVESLEAWADDPDTTLPTCERSATDE